MHSKSITVAVVVFVILIAGMFGYAYLKQKELTTVDKEVPQDVLPDPYGSITRIDAKHFYQNGKHTIVGEIPMPTQCDLLEWDAAVAESAPEQVTIKFTVINNSDSCPSVTTPQRFKVEFEASEEAKMSAELNGRTVELNLIPGAPGETPEDFELFIKG